MPQRPERPRPPGRGPCQRHGAARTDGCPLELFTRRILVLAQVARHGPWRFLLSRHSRLEGAAHDADDSDITWDGLRAFVKKRVPATVKSLYGKDGGEQRPNEVGNLSGEPTVLAVARITATPARPEPKVKPRKPMAKSEKPVSDSTDPFAGTSVGQTRNDDGLGTTLVWIPAGEFRNFNDVQMTLTKGFWLGQHEVTQAEWWRVMQTTPWGGKVLVKKGDRYPATYVSWDDAMRFCEKLTEQERTAGWLPSRWRYTLPTEAEWEYACRAGTKSRYSFGDDDDAKLGDYAWFDKNALKVGEEMPTPSDRRRRIHGDYSTCTGTWTSGAETGTRRNLQADRTRRARRQAHSG